MLLRPETAQRQLAFAAHLRDPQVQAAPTGLAPVRVELYCTLFFNNVANFLGQSFPVSRSIVGDTAWRRLCRAFYTRHQSHSPLFPELPQQFLRFAQAQPESFSAWPYLLELLHYEWVEIALDYDPDELPAACPLRPDQALALSPLALPLAYEYPVHKLALGNLPEKPATASFLLVWRDRSDQVRFQELSPMAIQLAARFQASAQAPVASVQALTHALPEAQRAAAEVSGMELISRWVTQDILVAA